MGAELIAILIVFVFIMGGVLWMCLAARRSALARETTPRRTDTADDKRIAAIIFIAILAGAGLALFTANLLFFNAT
jgi:hypothetical protein